MEGERYSLRFTSTSRECEVQLCWESSQLLVIFTVALRESIIVKKRTNAYKIKKKEEKKARDREEERESENEKEKICDF